MDAFLHLELLVQSGVQPPAGVLLVAGHPEVRFSGYLELLAAIERVTAGPVPEARAAEQ